MVGRGLGVGVRDALGLGVQVGQTRVGVGVGVAVDVAVGVSVGVGVRVGAEVSVGVGVVVGVLVGVGVIDGVSEGVTEGTSTRTGTSLATACTVLTATEGLNLDKLLWSQGAIIAPSTRPVMIATASKIGRSQSCRSRSPQAGHTLWLWLLTAPQYRQRTCRDSR